MINDLPSHMHNPERLFADDTSILFSHQPSDDISDQNNEETERLKQWTGTWIIDVNPTKTKSITVSLANNRTIPTHALNNTPIKTVTAHKHLAWFSTIL